MYSTEFENEKARASNGFIDFLRRIVTLHHQVEKKKKINVQLRTFIFLE